MHLNFNTHLAGRYKSQSQAIRVMTEDWVKSQIFCPNCGCRIDNFKSNSPVADFYCIECSEEYELKSKKNSLGQKIINGAYGTMIERLNSAQNPSFFFLNYILPDYRVKNFIVIPKYFFIREIIEKRKPLSENARRAGWIGCNILLRGIPQSGKIYFVRNGNPETKESILKNWQKTLFLGESRKAELKGWILDIMKCIDELGKREFSISELYSFENALSIKYKNNRHIKDKIRQQLQFLRDRGYLEFTGRGIYRLT